MMRPPVSLRGPDASLQRHEHAPQIGDTGLQGGDGDVRSTVRSPAIVQDEARETGDRREEPPDGPLLPASCPRCRTSRAATRDRPVVTGRLVRDVGAVGGPRVPRSRISISASSRTRSPPRTSHARILLPSAEPFGSRDPGLVAHCRRGRREPHGEGGGGAHRDQGQPGPVRAPRGRARRAADPLKGSREVARGDARGCGGRAVGPARGELAKAEGTPKRSLDDLLGQEPRSPVAVLISQRTLGSLAVAPIASELLEDRDALRLHCRIGQPPGAAPGGSSDRSASRMRRAPSPDRGDELVGAASLDPDPPHVLPAMDLGDADAGPLGRGEDREHRVAGERQVWPPRRGRDGAWGLTYSLSAAVYMARCAAGRGEPRTARVPKEPGPSRDFVARERFGLSRGFVR